MAVDERQPRAGVHYPRSTGEFQSWFAHRRGLPGLPGVAALAGRVRLPELRACRRLGGRLMAGTSAPAVRQRTSVTAGTIFDRTPDAADGVVHGLLAVRHAEGRHLGAEPAAGAGDRLLPDGVGDAAPAARRCWCGPGRDRLTGTVEVDETFIGGEEPGLRGGRAKGKKLLVGIAVEVSEPRGYGRCRMAMLADASAASLHPFVTGNVEPGATVITDGWRATAGSSGLGYTHERRSQRAARARGEDPGELLPGVHRVASLAKRWLLGTHQGSVEPAHLQSYLNEFVFRFNRRRSRSRGMVFYRVLELAVGHDPVRYRDLVADPKPKASPTRPRPTRRPSAEPGPPTSGPALASRSTCASPVR